MYVGVHHQTDDAKGTGLLRFRCETMYVMSSRAEGVAIIMVTSSYTRNIRTGADTSKELVEDIETITITAVISCYRALCRRSISAKHGVKIR